jgi:type II secretory pathway pseudopilin PulG
MNFYYNKNNKNRAYTLVELTIAASIIGSGLLAVAALTNLSEDVDNIHQPKRRVIAIMEARAKLWQLGCNVNGVNSFAFSDPALPVSASDYVNTSAARAVNITLNSNQYTLNFTRLTQEVKVNGASLPVITSIQSSN